MKVQAGPEIKGGVTSPSWENREKFAVVREKCLRTEDTRQKHGYIISSYEHLADLFFFSILQYQTKQYENKIIDFHKIVNNLLFLNIFISVLSNYLCSYI